MSLSRQDEIDAGLIVTESIAIEKRFHGAIMGPKGARLLRMIQHAGGSSEAEISDFVKLPRATERNNDVIQLQGSPEFVARLKDLIITTTEALRARVVLALVVPASQHGAVIGRGGERVKDLHERFGVFIQIGQRESRPGHRPLGAPLNEDQVRDADPADLIKVCGPRVDCEGAMAEIRSLVTQSEPRIVLGVVVRERVQSRIIGPGGRDVKKLSARHEVLVCLPGGVNYRSLGPVINEEDLEDVFPADIVKVRGTRSACENAREAISSLLKEKLKEKRKHGKREEIKLDAVGKKEKAKTKKGSKEGKPERFVEEEMP